MKKFGNFMFAMCVVLLIVIATIVKPLSNLDEVWNFNVGRCIANGLVPYKDISMVSTPLLGFLISIPLRIFGQEMFYIRVFAIILGLLCFISIFKIFKKLEIKSEITNIFILVITALLCNFIYAEYNLLSLFFILQIISLEIRVIKNKRWDRWVVDLLIGLLAGLIICSKQSIGLVISIIAIIIPALRINGKKDLYKGFRSFITRFIGVLVPVDILLFYLKQNGAFHDFLNYSVYGLKTFSNSVSYKDFFFKSNELYKLLAIIVPLVIITTIIVSIVFRIKKKSDKIASTVALYSLGTFAMVYPIADRWHFSIAIIPGLILMVYVLKLLCSKSECFRNMNFKYLLEFINVCSILSILVATVCIEFVYRDNLGMTTKYDYQKHFRYINISAVTNNSINEINEFASVKEKKVYILDASAAVYMIPIDRYNKNYDMFLLGNIGAGGEDAIIEQIKSEDALYFIAKDEANVNWQNPPKVRAYIKENMECLGVKGYFEIYQNKTEDNTKQE